MSYDIKPIHLNQRIKLSLSLWHGMVPTDPRWTMPEIIELVSTTYGVKIEELKGPARERRVAWPRQHAMWLMCQQPHLSLSMVGSFLGGRDHTTVLHGRNAFQRRLNALAAQREAA